MAPYPAYKDSDVPWVTRVPAEWGVDAVKRHYAIQLGKMLQGERSAPGDLEVPYLKSQHVQWFAVRTSAAPTMWASPHDVEQYGVRVGDLLVCEGGEGGRCGTVREIPDSYIIQNALHRVRPLDQCRNGYLQWLMSAISATGWFDAINSKATIAHFTREKFGALLIPVPSPSEQAGIVRFLDNADRRIRRYIAAKKKLIVLRNEQKQAIILHAVTRGLDPRVNLKPSGVEWLGGAVPEHWDVVRLGSVLRERGEKNDAGAVTDVLSLLRGRGVIPYDEKGNIGNKKSEDITRYKIVRPNDIVVNCMNVIIGSVGLSVHTGCLSPVYYVLMRRSERDDPEYLSAVFQCKPFHQSLVRIGNGILAHRMRIPMELLKSELLPYPPPEEQNRIVRALREMTRDCDFAIDRTEREVGLIREFRMRLIADVVTGQLDVREAATRLPDEVDQPEVLDDADALLEGDESDDEGDLDGTSIEVVA